MLDSRASYSTWIQLVFGARWNHAPRMYRPFAGAWPNVTRHAVCPAAPAGNVCVITLLLCEPNGRQFCDQAGVIARVSTQAASRRARVMIAFMIPPWGRWRPLLGA